MTAGTLSMVPASALSLSLADLPAGAEFENLGTTVEVVMPEEASPGAMSFQGVAYTLKQFHFHLPSEHLDDGASMAMETHFVWEGAAGELAVIGVWIDLDDGTGGSGGGGNTTEPVVARRSGKHEWRDLIRERQDERRKRQLPPVEGSFFHVNAPNTAATTPSSVLETVLSSVSAIATPGTATTTQPLSLSQIAAALNAGSFQT
jgi:hypothetical protein